MRETSGRNSLRRVALLTAVIITPLAVVIAQLGSQAAPKSRSTAAPPPTQLGAYGGGCPAAYKPGTYGFIGLGQELTNNPFGEPAGPIASILVVRSNGDGTLSVQRTDFANGALIVTPTVPGTYSVGDDCTVADTIPIPGTGALTGYGVIVQGGAEVDYMATTEGVVVQNYVGRRMPNYCTNEVLQGTYGITGTGTSLSTNSLGLPAGPMTTIGTLYFDGKGSFRKENEQAFINGSSFPIASSTGSYSVSADCRVTITATTDKLTAIGVVVDAGNSIAFIPTTPGALVANVVGKKVAEISTAQPYASTIAPALDCARV